MACADSPEMSQTGVPMRSGNTAWTGTRPRFGPPQARPEPDGPSWTSAWYAADIGAAHDAEAAAPVEEPAAEVEETEETTDESAEDDDAEAVEEEAEATEEAAEEEPKAEDEDKKSE